MTTRRRIVGLADVVSSTRMGGSDWALLTPRSVGATSGFMGAMTLEPGEYVSRHLHPFSDEFIYVTGGGLEVDAGRAHHRLPAKAADQH